VDHAILTCQYVSEVWHEIKRCFGLILNIKYLVCIKQWLFDFLDDASDNQKTTYYHCLAYLGGKNCST
jgi:hypothetical protein